MLIKNSIVKITNNQIRNLIFLMEKNNSTFIDLQIIDEFSIKMSIKNEFPTNMSIKDEFDEFSENFLIQMKLKNDKMKYEKISTQNIRQNKFFFKNKEFFLIIIAYSNINFIILSENKKLGNLYTADVEEPEYRIDEDEEVEDLPPEYEIKCILGNRFDNLNAFFSNYLASNFFNLFQKANKSLYEKPKFIKLDFGKNQNFNIENLEFYKNDNSFFNNYVKNTSNLLISLDLTKQYVFDEESKGDDKSTFKQMEEFEISELTSKFNDELKVQIINILN